MRSINLLTDNSPIVLLMNYKITDEKSWRGKNFCQTYPSLVKIVGICYLRMLANISIALKRSVLKPCIRRIFLLWIC